MATKLHFVLFPLMAPGHMIPLIDMAKLIANHDITVTVLTTPVNAARFRRTIDRAIQTGLDLRVAELEFPCQDSEFPQGLENIDMLPSLNTATNFILAASKLREPVENLLQKLEPEPSCLISDMGFSWTTQIALKFNIPRIVFHGTCCFSLLCSHNLIAHKLVSTMNLETKSLIVPGLPDRIELTKAQLPSTVYPITPDMNDLREKMRAAEKESFGVVVNSFKELEFDYFERYKEVKGKKRVWCVGPVSLCSKDNLEKGNRGNNAAIDTDKCLQWLDSHKHESVIYACLGSLCNLVGSKIMELALGLEESNKPFVLVLRKGYDIDEDGFEERVKGRGLVIRGWAPQVLILSHPAVGVFLTHCGWNSTLEGISYGVPMITWPLFAEQFLNEKLVVQVLRVGISVRSERNKEDVRRAVELMMEEGEETEKMRERARKLRESANRAVEEGGSSNEGMRAMIQEIRLQQKKKGLDR